MWKPLVLILLIISIGVIGYQVIEGLSPMDSLYMTVITIFTVGFKEVKELSPLGQLFTIFIILGGVGTAIFTFTKLGEIVFEGGLDEFWWRRRMKNKIENLKDHYIICGHGRMGRTVREKLEEEKASFIVIDNREEKLKEIDQAKSCLYLKGDATHEEVLLKAGVKKAKGLAALLPTDADNLYLTLTAKQINPSLFVLSKALDEEGERKIIQIGANRVISPYKLSALKIAQGLMRPTLLDFMDLIIRRKELSLVMEEVIIPKDSFIIGKNLRQCQIRQKANVIVVAIKKPGEDIDFNPSPETEIQVGDTLLVLGAGEAIKGFEKQFILKLI